MSIGFKVLERKRAVSAEWVEKFKSLPVANISDVMHRLTAGGPRLRPYHASGVLCGAALTVKSRPGDNLMAHMALTMAQPGDVIVVDAGGDMTNSIIGERMMVNAQRRGFAGWVVDGAIRDLEWVKKNTLPVFAAGISHRGPYKTGPGEINVPVAIDGMVIEPGDLIIGDDDGLLCVPFDQVEAVYAMAKEKHASESTTFDAIGKSDQAKDRAKLTEQLKALGCAFG
ncbi:MAG: RraA family protein [Pseudomonadota bacterium]